MGQSGHAVKPRGLDLQAVSIKKEELDLVQNTTDGKEGILKHHPAVRQTSASSQPIELSSDEEDDLEREEGPAIIGVATNRGDGASTHRPFSWSPITARYGEGSTNNDD